MSEVFLIAGLALGLNLALSLVAMLRQPTASDLVLSAQLLGTNGVGLVLLIAFHQGQAGLMDVALVLALLAAVMVVAFTRRQQEPGND